MGGGKGSIDHFVTPVKAGRIILEVAGYCEYSEVFPFLKMCARILPFPAEPISQEILDGEKEYEDYVEQNNMNPFTFKYCLENNMMGCRKWASPYDYKWHNKYR
jgi:large subunit ribosomal protein L16